MTGCAIQHDKRITLNVTILAGRVLAPAGLGMAGDTGCISSGNMATWQQPILADLMLCTADAIGTEFNLITRIRQGERGTAAMAARIVTPTCVFIVAGI